MLVYFLVGEAILIMENNNISNHNQKNKRPLSHAQKIAVMKRKRRKKILSNIGHVCAFVFGTIGALVIFVLLVMLVLTHGPSEKAKNLFVLSTNETSAIYFLPSWFLSQEEIDSILNPPATEDSFTELSFDKSGDTGFLTASDSGNTENADTPAITEPTLIDVSGPTFKGKMLIVPDPSQVKFVSVDSFGGYGIVLSKFIEKYNGIGGINAGGFEDEDGRGTGGIPDGIVIKDGKIAYGSAGEHYIDVMGFDSDNMLHVGNMTGQEALNAGIVNGVSFHLGPVLIQDGVRNPNLTSGINPRTSIGQSADGTVYLVCVEGRFPDSLGATCNDMASLMEEYGVINAANLDGGSSSGMYYMGERVTRSCSVIGDRPLCTAVVVTGE